MRCEWKAEGYLMSSLLQGGDDLPAPISSGRARQSRICEKIGRENMD
jgi:hypothetical protein